MLRMPTAGYASRPDPRALPRGGCGAHMQADPSIFAYSSWRSLLSVRGNDLGRFSRDGVRTAEQVGRLLARSWADSGSGESFSQLRLFRRGGPGGLGFWIGDDRGREVGNGTRRVGARRVARGAREARWRSLGDPGRGAGRVRAGWVLARDLAGGARGALERPACWPAVTRPTREGASAQSWSGRGFRPDPEECSRENHVLAGPCPA